MITRDDYGYKEDYNRPFIGTSRIAKRANAESFQLLEAAIGSHAESCSKCGSKSTNVLKAFATQDLLYCDNCKESFFVDQRVVPVENISDELIATVGNSMS